MKILFLSDYGLKHTIGGAQRSNRIIIDKGLSRGHEIVELHYDDDLTVLQNQSQHKFDWIISSNLEAFNQRVVDLVEYLDSIPNHIRLEHDMNRYLSDQRRYLLWRNCKASFFLTEFHYECFRRDYGDYFKNVYIVPDPIDRSFKDLNLGRADMILYAGFMHPFKGTLDFIQFVKDNPDKNFIVAGWGPPEIEAQMRLPNIGFLGKVDHNSMPELYSCVSSYYHMPRMYEPFCRSAGEALVCGVPNMLVNDMIGAKRMWDKDPKGFSEKCYNASVTFWECVECL